jgi:transcriptional regulator with XRE-family HTH domain
MPEHYGDSHMAMHIGNYYRPATFNCMGTAIQRGARVRSMRKALEMNQKDLAVQLGVDQSTVSDIENGKGFSAEILMKLAGALQTTPSMVMQGHDEASWPFKSIPIEAFTSLDADNRLIVEGRLAEILEGLSPTPVGVATEQLRQSRLQVKRKGVTRRAA